MTDTTEREAFEAVWRDMSDGFEGLSKPELAQFKSLTYGGWHEHGKWMR